MTNGPVDPDLAQARARVAAYLRENPYIFDVMLDGFDFTGMDLSGRTFINCSLRGCKFYLARMEAAHFSGCDLREANFQLARFTGGSVMRSELNGADMSSASLEGTAFRTTNMNGVDLSTAHLSRGHTIYETTGEVEFHGQARIDADTYIASGWTPEYLRDLVNRGLKVNGLSTFPPEAQAALGYPRVGLTLFVWRHLLPWDQTMLHAYACSVLGTTTDVRVAEYSEIGEGCRVRLVGSNPADLDNLAEHISRVSWRADAQFALAAARVQGAEPSLDFIRTHLDKQERWGTDGSSASLVLQRSWDAELLQAALTEVLERAGVKALVEAGARTAGRLLTAASDVRDQADIARWEASIAKQELAEEDG